MIYQIQGLIIPDEKQEIVLLEDLPHLFKAFLSKNLDAYCTDIDRRAVIGKKILSGLGEKTFESHIEETKKQRNEKFATPPFLIIEACGDDSSFIPEEAVDKGDYALCIQNETGAFSKGQYQNQINSVLSSLCLSIDTFYKYKKVGESVVYYNSDGKPIHNILISVKGKGFSSRKVLDIDIETTKSCSSIMSQNEIFSTICRLLVQSIDSKSDELLSYLSVWTALEVFINKMFRVEKQNLIACLTERGLIDQTLREEIERKKFSLMNKFKMLCLYLNNQVECPDIKTFKKLKDSRDELLHGDEIDFAKLPVFETQNLLRKYLFVYVQCV